MTTARKNRHHRKKLPPLVMARDTLAQPLDHSSQGGEMFQQRIFLFLPEPIAQMTQVSTDGAQLGKIERLATKMMAEEIRHLASVPVFFILGNEDDVKPAFLRKRLYNYYTSEMVFLTAEHRGYGPSISEDPDQSLPAYVSIPQALQDYHRVVQHYRPLFTGQWIAVGYSYGGGLVINFGYQFPGDVQIILSSSGVVDWSFLMTAYDQQVRENLGTKLYGRLERHVSNLRPLQAFDQNWQDRELILAFITGLAQMDTFNALLPIFRLITRFSTKRFIAILKWLDRAVAANAAMDYVASNSKRTLSSEEAKTGHYTWHVWRYQQFYETGVFWQSAQPPGVYQRTLEELKEECRLMFGVDPPLLSKPKWDPLAMVPQLQVPLVYVCGGRDPWKGVCLPPDYRIPNGKYFYFHDRKHCPDGVYPLLANRVINEIHAYLQSPKKDAFFTQNTFYTTEEKHMIPKQEFAMRIEKLQAKIAAEGLDAFIVSDSGSIFYYTGASYKAQERPFFIIVPPTGEPTFLVPKLEESHMEKANIGAVQTYWEFPAPAGQGWPERLGPILQRHPKIGVEPSITLENYQKIAALPEVQGASVTVSPIVEGLRLVKSPAEIAMIRDSARYADMGMKLMMQAAYYGISVLEMFSLAKKVQLEVIKTGEFDPLQTEFLTATWPAPFSAKPHGVPPVDGKLKDGPLAAMSYLRVNGYAAECERTFFLAPPTDQQRKMFEAMRTAREKAFALIRPGARAADVDKAAMEYLKEAGYGDFLLHRTGHGIGQGNHEGPWVAEGSEHVLEENMLISVEPGIYIPEVGGVRHSDTVLVTKDGYEVLTKYPTDIKSLTILKGRPLKKLKGKVIQKAVGMQ